MQNQTSKIIAQNENYNVWLINDQIAIAPKTSVIDTNGNPTGARWECSYKHWELYRNTAYQRFLDI